MGGNALSVETIRLDAATYKSVCRRVMSLVLEVFPGRRVSVIPAYSEKSDFGDMDILIEGGAGYDSKLIAAALNATEVVRNGDVTSMGLQIGSGIFQLDFIKIPAESFDFALRYFSMNDLGNLLGRVAHKAGFKLGQFGLRYVLKGKNKDHVIAEIPVTMEWGSALNLLGYNSAAYEQGFNGKFKSLTDIFNFVISSPYFNKDIYLLENRNAISRTRDRKRKTYMFFLEWLKTIPEDAAPRFDWSDKLFTRGGFLDAAFQQFPAFRDEYLRVQAVWRDECICREKFNGSVVGKLSGLSGKELGELMRKARSSLGDASAVRQWLLLANEEDVRALVMRTAAEIHEQAMPVSQAGTTP